ncbi:MAG: ImmA/IrrE family metallo-endopeptidase [Candidatus Acidulodesulfobacterium ferriphilum]|uniref:ImmA/IrrE family metallo-endopeptidase n=1 Tax=Candidatus Acidulodesulfobacterium ferriphilum TaxID=2597223 RepID=A0A519BAJ2_9DELT|nr:MAG: ImmA/IrrE family metallo-endopeptidase [Candidatus Acidulodesulfobacterium ferriphilum]
MSSQASFPNGAVKYKKTPEKLTKIKNKNKTIMNLTKIINGLEIRIKGFNKIRMLPEDLLKTAEDAGIITVIDETIPYSKSFVLNKHRYIYYNPDKEENIFTLFLGHELGHFLLDHHNLNPLYQSPFSLFHETELEREANVIAFLFWYPTIFIERKLKKYGRLEANMFFNEFQIESIKTELLTHLINTRLKIYEDYCSLNKYLK